MRHMSSRSLTCLPLLLACLIAAVPSAAGSPRLDLTAPQARYLVQEALLLRVSLTNPGNEEVTTLALLRAEAGLLRLQISPPGQKTHTLRPWAQDELGPSAIGNAVITLVPGAYYDAIADLTYEMRDGKCVPVLSQPGE